MSGRDQSEPLVAISRCAHRGLLPERGQRIALPGQAHLREPRCSEHWLVVRGVAEVTIGEDVKLYYKNESAYVPIGAVHRLANPGKIPLELIEVQVGSYLGENDILQLEDVYRREREFIG
jgi:mannose-1-phosphate guanylyltransferase/mannose-6-phosphate isomerase